MVKRVLCVLCGIVLLCTMLVGCSVSDKTSDTPDFSYSMNFFKDEFEEEYSHYEKSLEVSEGSSEIVISGQTSSGKINIQIVSSDGENEIVYEYVINGVTEETIELSEEHSLNWTAVVDCYEDTEGSFEISVK